MRKVQNIESETFYDYYPYILKQQMDKAGYLRCWIHFPSKSKSFPVHVLVCDAFYKKPLYKVEVGHKKNIRHFNFVENIGWVTKQENIDHKRFVHPEYEVIDIVSPNNSLYNQKKKPRKQDGYCYIYGICNEDGFVVYVGKATDAVQRFRQHKTWARHPVFVGKYNLEWLRDILLKEPNPKMILLKKVEVKEWEFWEQHFISEYRKVGLLFNKSAGGNKMAPSTQAIHVAYWSNPILQYDLSGKFIREWRSSAEAARAFKVSSKVVQRAVRGGRATCAKYIWRLKTENYPQQIPIPNRRQNRTPILQIKSNGDRVRWKSTNEAVKTLGFKKLWEVIDTDKTYKDCRWI